MERVDPTEERFEKAWEVSDVLTNRLMGSSRGGVAFVAAGLALIAAAGQPGPSPELQAKDREIASLKAQVAEL